MKYYFYRLTKGEKTIYIFPTIHILQNTKLPDAINKNFAGKNKHLHVFRESCVERIVQDETKFGKIIYNLIKKSEWIGDKNKFVEYFNAEIEAYSKFPIHMDFEIFKDNKCETLDGNDIKKPIKKIYDLRFQNSQELKTLDDLKKMKKGMVKEIKNIIKCLEIPRYTDNSFDEDLERLLGEKRNIRWIKKINKKLKTENKVIVICGKAHVEDLCERLKYNREDLFIEY